MIKRSISPSVNSNVENDTGSSAMQVEVEETKEISETSKEILLHASDDDTERSIESKVLSSREQTMQREATSLGAIEDVLQCTVCKGRLKSPRMMPCQHTFCLECLKKQADTSKNKNSSFACPICNVILEGEVIENLPTNLYIETLLNLIADTKKEESTSKNTKVSFAPLPPKIREEFSPILKCRICGQICDNRCRHCKRSFCFDCWTSHVTELKEELNNINGDLEISATRFKEKISSFRRKAHEMREVINRDVDGKIAELNKKRENRTKKVEEIVAAGETSMEDIQRRMYKTQMEIRDQKEISYDLLPDNEEKIKIFLNLQQKAAELMAAVTIWESELNDIEIGFGKIKERGGSFIKENTGPFYKRKAFAPKIIVNRDMVQRPSALAVDPWRDHIIATCPGSGQVVIFDRKYKLLRRIRHQEMMAPQGVAFLQEYEEIYVTDKWKHCIFVFNRKGELLRRMCNKGQGESQLRSPEGIAIHPERNVLYVADTGNDRIQILDKDGGYLGSIGPTTKHTTSNIRFRKITQVINQLYQPTDVAVTATRVVVADCGNHKVKMFDNDGQILRTIGGVGTSKGLFRSPEVLHIDKKGNIIVGDTENRRVQIFSPEGEFLRALGAKGTKNCYFGWISGVLVTNNYDIFVADSKNNVIYLL